jgi:hypothetical protein
MNLLVLLTVGVKIFEKMYMKYEPEGKEKKVVQEQKLCFYILEAFFLYFGSSGRKRKSIHSLQGHL